MKESLFAVSFLFLFAATPAPGLAGEGLFPLDLKVARDMHDEAHVAVRMQHLETNATAPQGLSLPPSAASSLKFAKWVTPMAKEGFLWMAVGRSTANGEYDTLYVDANGDGSVADETAAKAYEAKDRYSRFGPVRVTFPGGDKPAEYYLNVYCRRYPGLVPARGGNERTEGVMLFISSGCWREGAVRIGDKEYKCSLFDYNGNGTFNDTSMNPEEMDRIAVGAEDGAPRMGLGKYIRVSGALYHPEPAPGGGFIRFTPADNVPMGKVKVNKDIGMFILTGENGQFVFDSNNGPVEVPSGRWRPDAWRIERKDAKGEQWHLMGQGFPASSVFEVAEGEETSLELGEPLKSALHVGRSVGDSAGYVFEENLLGRSGETVKLVSAKTYGVPPKLRIRNADGTYDNTLPFEAG